MEIKKINDRLLAVISFTIFLVNIAKYYLINVKQLIYSYSPQNRVISYIMLPILCIGMLFSLITLFKNVFHRTKSIVNIFLSIPLIGFIVYFFFIK